MFLATRRWYIVSITTQVYLCDFKNVILTKIKGLAQISKNEENEFPVIIKYLCKKALAPKKIYEDMINVLGQGTRCCFISISKNWEYLKFVSV